MFKYPMLAATPLTDERLADQYDLNLAIQGDLGFSDREIAAGVPPLETIRDVYSDSDRDWVNEQVASGYTARLTIARSVQAIGLEGERHSPGLIPRFDLKQAKGKKGATVIRKPWRTIGDKYPVHDNGLNEPFSVAILLTPAGELSINGQAEGLTPEQVLRGIISTTTKMKALDKQHYEQARLGRRVVSAPINHLVSYEAQIRHAGERGFHHRNASCLVHYPPLANNRSDTRPTLYRSGRYQRHLELGSRMLYVANEVVLRVLHLPVTAATAKT